MSDSYSCTHRYHTSWLRTRLPLSKAWMLIICRRPHINMTRLAAHDVRTQGQIAGRGVVFVPSTNTTSHVRGPSIMVPPVHCSFKCRTKSELYNGDCADDNLTITMWRGCWSVYTSKYDNGRVYGFAMGLCFTETPCVMNETTSSRLNIWCGVKLGIERTACDSRWSAYDTILEFLIFNF